MATVPLESNARIQNAQESAFWLRHLGYGHAFVTVLGALAVGLALHIFAGYRGQSAPQAYLIVGGVPVLAILIAGRLARKDRTVQWLCGIPFAIVSTTATGVLALVGGIIPQSVIQRTGAPSMWSSWPFLMLLLLMLVNLVGSSARRCWPLNYTNITYLASHLGLSLAIIGGALSATSLERNNLVLFQNTPTAKAFDSSEKEVGLPFKATLREFQLETFPPTLALATVGEKGDMKLAPGSNLLKKGVTDTINGYKVEVLEFHERAVFAGDTWKEVPWKSAGPAAKVRATNASGKVVEGWVSCGSVESQAAILELGPNQALAMPDPRPKKFLSKVDLELDGQTKSVEIEVNKPAHIAGYDLYQLSYDDKMGAASEYSVIEVVKDRGLGVVYLGIFMMLFGCGLHLWNGIGGKK